MALRKTGQERQRGQLLPLLIPEQKLLIIAGPCSLETREVSWAVAAELKRVAETIPQIEVVFKGSFDKANRTSAQSPRGPGLAQGLAMLAELRDRFGLRVTSDLHERSQVPAVAEICDVLQVPAFLCRQTDLIQACGTTGRIVNVKKGQFLTPEDARFIAEKLTDAGAPAVWLTERGACFGYGDLVVDPRSYSIMRPFAQRIVHDATHCLQSRQGGAGRTGGERRFLRPLARAALAAGANAIFLEVHPEPEKAISDANTQLPLTDLMDVIRELANLWSYLWQASRGRSTENPETRPDPSK